MIITCWFTVQDRIELLPTFLEYYKKLGVDTFVGLVTNGSKNPFWPHLVEISSPTLVFLRGHELVYPAGHADNEALNQARRSIVSDWDVICDLDEFHYFNGDTIPTVISAMKVLKADLAMSKLVDRISEQFPSKPPPEADWLQDLDEKFPYKCNLTECINGNVNKVAIIRNGIDTTSGHHSAPGIDLHCRFETHHFKWTHGVRERCWDVLCHLLPVHPEFKEICTFTSWIEGRETEVNKRLEVSRAERLFV